MVNWPHLMTKGCLLQIMLKFCLKEKVGILLLGLAVRIVVKERPRILKQSLVAVVAISWLETDGVVGYENLLTTESSVLSLSSRESPIPSYWGMVVMWAGAGIQSAIGTWVPEIFAKESFKLSQGIITGTAWSKLV